MKTDFLRSSLQKRYAIAFLILGVFMSFFFSSSEVLANSIATIKESRNDVIEHLRIHVPKEDRNAWLAAEKGSWEPWLRKQNGFLYRQLFWDPDNEQATLLISWQTRAQWKSISQEEINKTQDIFEKLAREATGKANGNPFPLVFEGELIVQ